MIRLLLLIVLTHITRPLVIPRTLLDSPVLLFTQPHSLFAMKVDVQQLIVVPADGAHCEGRSRYFHLALNLVFEPFLAASLPEHDYSVLI